MRDQDTPPAKTGPWQGVLLLAATLAIVLAFVAAVIGLIKWAS